MKILIFSDSHGDSTTMCNVVENEQPDMIIYLGDGIADTEEVSRRHHDIKMIKVLGSLDSNKDDEEWIKYAEICDKRFMLTHGHTFYNDYVIRVCSIIPLHHLFGKNCTMRRRIKPYVLLGTCGFPLLA